METYTTGYYSTLTAKELAEMQSKIIFTTASTGNVNGRGPRFIPPKKKRKK